MLRKIFVIIFLVFFLIFLNDRYGFIGFASWYGNYSQERTTANGEIFNDNAFTCAHRRLAFGKKIKVINLTNGKEVIVRVNDRGPYILGRIIDLSKGAAEQIEMIEKGSVPVLLLLI